MKIRINWSTFGALIASAAVSGQLTQYVPDKVKPFAALLPSIIPALFPQLVTREPVDPAPVDPPAKEEGHA